MNPNDTTDSELPEVGEIEIEDANDETTPVVTYNIGSFGADFDVEGLVRRLKRGDIIIPSFQRSFVWSQPVASRFIESLLLGLPVPGIFLATDPTSKQQLVIDGLQRLKTLQFFFDGHFNPKPEAKTKRVFKLQGVATQFNGKTHSDLSEPDRRRLENSVIHATVVEQKQPAGDDTSTYHIFERLNSGGMKLTAQEIRSALYHGGLLDEIEQLNEFEPWRELYGKPSRRLKDRELILRFLALRLEPGAYERPMSEYLNKFAGRHQNPPRDFLEQARSLFKDTILLLRDAVGKSAFRPERALNAAVFDSVMVGVSSRLKSAGDIDYDKLSEASASLFQDPEYVVATSRATADESAVTTRLQKAIDAFSGV